MVQLRRKVIIERGKNPELQFIRLMNVISKDPMTERELDIFYEFLKVNPKEINTASREAVSEKFGFNNKSQIANYVGILFRKKFVYRSSVKNNVYLFNPMYIYDPNSQVISEIVISFSDGEKRD